MKLPGIKRLEVQGLGRRDASIPLKGAKAVRTQNVRGENENFRALEFRRQARKEDLRKEGAVFDSLPVDVRIAQVYHQSEIDIAKAKEKEGQGKAAQLFGIASIFEAGAKMSLENQKFKAQKTVQEASSFAQREDAAFQEKYGGKAYLTPADLVGTVADTPANNARQQIPAAEVMPALYKEHMDRVITEGGKVIENDYFREGWTNDANKTLVGRMAKVQTDANKYLQEQYVFQQKQDVKKALEEGNYPLALSIVPGMFASEAEKKALTREIHVEAEKGYYDGLITNKNERVLKDEVTKIVNQSHEEYAKGGGYLSSQERLAARDKMARELSRIDSSKESTKKADYSILKSNVKTHLGRLLEGNPVDPMLLTDQREKLIGSLGEPGGANLEDIRELDVAIMANGEMMGLSMQSYAKRSQSIGMMESAAKGQSDPTEGATWLQVHSLMKTSSEAQLKNMQNDLVQTSMDVGQDLTVLDYKDSATFSKTLTARVKEVKALSINYEVESQGPLSKNEVTWLNSKISNASVGGKIGIYQDIVDGAGSEAHNLFDQLSVDGGSSAMAGEMMMGGQLTNAQLMLEGQIAYKENADLYKDVDINGEMTDILGTTYRAGDGSKESAVRDSVLYTYIGMARAENIDIEYGVDSDLLKRATYAVVGEIVTQSTGETTPFRRDMDQEEFDNYPMMLPPEVWQENGGIRRTDSSGMTEGTLSADIITEKLVDGDWTFQRVDKDTYFIIDEKGHALEGRDGNAYRHMYDPSRKMLPEPLSWQEVSKRAKDEEALNPYDEEDPFTSGSNTWARLQQMKREGK